MAHPALVGAIAVAIGWNAEVIGIKQSRESELEASFERQSKEIATLMVQKGLLEAQIEHGPGISERDALFKFINSIQRPGWCKEAVSIDSGDPAIEDLPPDFPLKFGIIFPMRHPNPLYAQAYGKSYAFYADRLDFAIYPRPVAEQYHANDLRVYTFKSFETLRENVVYASGRKAVEDFWKFYHQLADGSHFICGWQITWDSSPLDPQPVPARHRPPMWLPDNRRYGFWA